MVLLGNDSHLFFLLKNIKTWFVFSLGQFSLSNFHDNLKHQYIIGCKPQSEKDR